jgi:hypothetical protein
VTDSFRQRIISKLTKDLVLVQFEFFLSLTVTGAGDISRQFRRRVTPKVFANFSPGVELWQPWDPANVIWWKGATLKGLRPPRAKPVAIPSGLRQKQSPVFIPRVAKAQPLG